MTQDTPAFFTLDRGTVSTTAALIAPVDGRYRMAAAASAPVGIDPESVLEDLAWRVARTDASVAGSMEGWRDWSRLEVFTGPPPRGVLVAASEAAGEMLERAFDGAGWTIEGRFFGPAPDIVALGEACLDPDLHAVVMGGRDAAEENELGAAQQLWPRVASLARFRDDLAVVASGPFVDRPEGIPDGRLFSLPAPERVSSRSESQLRSAALQVGRFLADRGATPGIDARSALRASVHSLATVLEASVDGIEIGVASGSRTLAAPGIEQGHGVYATAGSFPRALLTDADAGDAVLRWSTLGGGDPAAWLDGVRNLVLRPWAAAGSNGARLRLAALRAALERLEAAWADAGDADRGGAGVVALSGGAFAGLPPAAVALALVDGVRRAGAVSLLHDHAGVLAPLGALPVEADRQRLLGDLMGDCLLPLGSAIVTGTIPERKKGKAPARMSIASVLGDQRLQLDPGELQLVDLPPGISASIGIDPGEGTILGSEGAPISMEVNGGLGGLFVDTRPIPLDLPDGGEARRSRLETWEAPVWAGSE
ncbi:MAG: hypothetical protein AB1Z67_12375 [Candidatus Limnocylindrales bacterium]